MIGYDLERPHSGKYEASDRNSAKWNGNHRSEVSHMLCVMSKVYVVTAPPSARGIYETWPECQAAVKGVTGAKFMGVGSRQKAESILNGEGVKLPPGIWAFTDANAAGGVGIVIVEQDANDEASLQESSATVQEILKYSGIPGLRTRTEVEKALGDLHNILSEMSGLYALLKEAIRESRFTVVYDYKGVEKWMVEGEWKEAKSPVIAALVAACKDQIRERDLHVSFQHQKGHSSTWAGRDDFARWNRRADELATQASKP